MSDPMLRTSGPPAAEPIDAPEPRTVSVVVAVRNAVATLRPCIESLLQLDYPSDRLQLLCVDNASTDATPRILAEYGERLTVVGEPRRGPAAARNRGLREARGEVVAFTDADCIVDRGWLRALVRPLGDPAVGAVGGRILSRRPANVVERFGERIHDHERALTVCRPPYAITMNWASRRGVLEEVAGFNEDLLRCEDVDLSYRILQSGYRLLYEPMATVYHHNERTPWGLMHEGYAHGYHAVAVLGLHAAFIDGIGAARSAAQASVAAAGPDRAAARVWSDPVWWSLFNLGKRLGRLHAAIAARHATR
jgi:cellulose synthase/poly-beta-1,6-N-acetylglucosamine synthase-like glycosyltransferase